MLAIVAGRDNFFRARVENVGYFKLQREDNQGGYSDVANCDSRATVCQLVDTSLLLTIILQAREQEYL